MRLINKIVFVSVALFFILGIYAYAADVAKIGIVDFRKILEESNTGKSGRAEIKKQGEKMEADLKKRGAEIDEMKKKYDKEAMVANKDARDEKERELQIKYIDFKNLEKKYTSEIKKLQSDFFISLKNEVDLIVAEIGKKDDYQIIIEKNEAGVFYSPASADITDRIIQKLNTKPAPKSVK
ncbi:MAG: OmpH family outer membrane protein [Desulfobacterium sp.]|nr:OmpH family outer membrane protein [Desulfobacterium sp.]MBU3947055.1 OmpH family outer membrane protein [Pseudomonadota bacterium]MBU4037242.1 OmpH family outer membrane protein [Pseudomonadota bacterium]